METMGREATPHNIFFNEDNIPFCRSAETYVELRLYQLCSVNERNRSIMNGRQINRNLRNRRRQSSMIFSIIVYTTSHIPVLL